MSTSTASCAAALPTGPVQEPVDGTLARRLRSLVLDRRRVTPRRPGGTVLHAGTAAVPQLAHVVRADDPADHAVRADVVAALLARLRRSDDAAPLLWLARDGSPVTEDGDLHWLSAARSACAEADVPLTLVVVTRSGWRDPRSDVRREWRRLRPG